VRNLQFYCVGILSVFAAGADCGTGGQGGNGSPAATSSDGKAAESADTVYHLTLDKPTIEQAIDSTVAKEANKFVRVEVSQVTNPAKHPLSFEVRYRSKTNVITYLGSFSLYPADNPGKFIVATQGKVKAEGAIILTLVAEDKVARLDVVRADVKRLALVER
jgi:hypothetical protein